MDQLDLAYAGIARQAELIRAGEVSPVELVELYLRRIERIDQRLNAFRIVFAERAGRAEAGGSYTAALLADPPQIGATVEEEAEEVARAARVTSSASSRTFSAVNDGSARSCAV